MNESVRLGRIAGVDVGVNWTVFVIFLLITFGLAAGRFPQEHPGLEPTAYVVAGVVAGLVFMASILAHEVSHAVVAQRNGVDVDGIVLWLFGGVARLRGEPGDPGAEIRVAGVGPLVSVGLGAAFGAVAVLLGGLGAPGITVGVFAWLAVINVVLAVFNLVPAAPLDGGGSCEESCGNAAVTASVRQSPPPAPGGPSVGSWSCSGSSTSWPVLAGVACGWCSSAGSSPTPPAQKSTTPRFATPSVTSGSTRS